MNEPPLRLYIHAPRATFVLPYIERELADVELVDEPKVADMAVMLSHVDIYGQTDGELHDEDTKTRVQDWIRLEEDFSESVNAPAIVLRTADIIGTGMNGFPMELAKMIASGRFFHFPDNEAHRSVIHASEIARAVAAIINKGISTGCHIYNLTDMVHPTVHDIAEALAFRMDNKRISTLSTRPQQWMGRKWYGRKLYALYTTSVTFDSSRFCKDFDFQPVPTIEYMRTHVYDHDSL